MTDSKSPSRGKVAFGALFAVAILGAGIADLANTIALHRSNDVVDAQVTDYRITSNKYGRSHELRYVFSATPNSPLIGRTDFLGRTDLWSTLPEPQWKEAIITGHVSVKFVPSKPGINAPAVALPKFVDNVIPILLGAVIGVCVVSAEVKRARQRVN